MRLCRLAVGGIALVVGVLAASAATHAQSQDKNSTIAPKEPAGPKKPVRKVTFVTTTDPVALLAVRRADVVQAPPIMTVDGSAGDGNGSGNETTKGAELAETERLIQDKQKKILLLLRLFATDEQMFLRDPSTTEKDASIQERRKYAQDELLWETAELARLKKRMNELEGSR